ncbi:Lrp/AsnC family transcriptional regulator [Streptomyces sp. NPDC059985]|uniref:Lrp/AsnC family transcriptional regulator n=1 Tax=Streptomyces sp. NPDC059985 TaxID=3347025 RepID=UPI0036C001C3
MSRSAPDAAPDPGEPLDALDHGVLRVLHRRPRASYSEVAHALGVHERTVARRLERMTGTGKVGFAAGLIPEHQGEGITAEVAVRCLPGRVHEVAVAVSALEQARSVETSTGSLDVFAELHLPDHEALLRLVDRVLGRIEGVADIHTSLMLRLVLTASDWAPYDDEPTAVRRFAVEGRALPEPVEVDDLDRRLVDLLHRDARLSTAHLARELNVGETTARRRLARLMDSHILHLRLHVDPAFLGYPVEARFRLGVPHSRLEEAMRLIAAEPSVRQLMVTSGQMSVLGYSSHRNLRDFHDFAARVFARLDVVTSSDMALLMKTYKRAGFLTDG